MKNIWQHHQFSNVLEIKEKRNTVTTTVYCGFSGAKSCESCVSCRKRSRGPSSSSATSCSSRGSRSFDALNRKRRWVILTVLQLCHFHLRWSKPLTYSITETSFSIYTEKHPDFFFDILLELTWNINNIILYRKINSKNSLSMLIKKNKNKVDLKLWILG